MHNLTDRQQSIINDLKQQFISSNERESLIDVKGIKAEAERIRKLKIEVDRHNAELTAQKQEITRYWAERLNAELKEINSKCTIWGTWKTCLEIKSINRCCKPIRIYIEAKESIKLHPKVNYKYEGIVFKSYFHYGNTDYTFNSMLDLLDSEHFKKCIEKMFI